MRYRRFASALLAVPLLAGGLYAGTAQPAASQAPVAATAGQQVTQPTSETARSLYLNNWGDTIGLWMGSKLSQLHDDTRYGPRLAELHYSPDPSPAGANAGFATNQIVDYTGFFRDETNGVSYTQVNNFDASAHVDSGGVLRTDYRSYDGQQTAVDIGRDYAMVPDENFTVVTYRLTNPGATPVEMNLLDQLHLNNVGKDGGAQVHATYDVAREAIVADMSASGQYHLVLGAYGDVDGHQVADDTVSDTNNPAVAPWYTFNASGTLPGNDTIQAGDVSVAFHDRITVPAGQTVTTSFYLAIADTEANALAAADTARAGTPAGWEAATATAYTNWLNAGDRISLSDTGLNTAYDRALVTVKQSQNPLLGTWPATTNPIAYGYKSWARDSSVTALIMNEAGHHAEAEQYLRWLAGAQWADGTFATTFDNWTGDYVPFVEPEHDSIGVFLVGVWRHFEATGDTAFRDAVWPAVQRSADFVAENLQGNGFGPADASIWEENIEYNTFTQAFYVAGLRAAAKLAVSRGDSANASQWNDATAPILNALDRSSLEHPAGMWNAPDQYYNRAVNLDNTARVLVDASTNIAFVLGVLDASSGRAASHLTKIETELGHDTWGIARYDGDVFYHTAPFSPAGDEALAPEPSWPQMSAYVGIMETYTGDTSDALARLTWYASRTAVGYMPPGEPISNVTRLPIISTMVEPVTGAWYVLAALTHTGQADLRVAPPALAATKPAPAMTAAAR